MLSLSLLIEGALLLLGLLFSIVRNVINFTRGRKSQGSQVSMFTSLNGHKYQKTLLHLGPFDCHVSKVPTWVHPLTMFRLRGFHFWETSLLQVVIEIIRSSEPTHVYCAVVTFSGTKYLCSITFFRVKRIACTGWLAKKSSALRWEHQLWRREVGEGKMKRAWWQRGEWRGWSLHHPGFQYQFIEGKCDY